MSNNAYQPPDWVSAPLEQLNKSQWEALCDRCGKCCLHKYYADEEDLKTRAENPHNPPEWLSHEFVYSQMTCQLYDIDNNCCSNYAERQDLMPDCVDLTPKIINKIDWLPTTCAYRLRYHQQPLPDWHPLMSGTTESVADAGVSIRAWAVGFNSHEDPLDYLVNFIP